MSGYLVPELCTRQLHHKHGRSISPSIYSFVKHSGAADEDWYLGYYPAWTRMAQGGVQYNSVHHPEDSEGPWYAPQGLDSYICKNRQVEIKS
jgi:hypothetical protein